MQEIHTHTTYTHNTHNIHTHNTHITVASTRRDTSLHTHTHTQTHTRTWCTSCGRACTVLTIGFLLGTDKLQLWVHTFTWVGQTNSNCEFTPSLEWDRQTATVSSHLHLSGTDKLQLWVHTLSGTDKLQLWVHTFTFLSCWSASVRDENLAKPNYVHAHNKSIKKATVKTKSFFLKAKFIKLFVGHNYQCVCGVDSFFIHFLHPVQGKSPLSNNNYQCVCGVGWFFIQFMPSSRQKTTVKWQEKSDSLFPLHFTLSLKQITGWFSDIVPKYYGKTCLTN